MIIIIIFNLIIFFYEINVLFSNLKHAKSYVILLQIISQCIKKNSACYVGVIKKENSQENRPMIKQIEYYGITLTLFYK